MADGMNSTSWLGDKMEMTDYMEYAIYTYIGMAMVATLVIAWMANLQIAKFSFFNTTLPFLDIGTDVKALELSIDIKNQLNW